jgi:hypothetical protein
LGAVRPSAPHDERDRHHRLKGRMRDKEPEMRRQQDLKRSSCGRREYVSRRDLLRRAGCGLWSIGLAGLLGPSRLLAAGGGGTGPSHSASGPLETKASTLSPPRATNHPHLP